MRLGWVEPMTMPSASLDSLAGSASPLADAEHRSELRASRVLLPLLVVISMLGPLALNILLPSLPGLVQVFGASRETVQLTLSLFLAGMAVSQLVLGPLADRFGRRPVLLWALVIFIAASAAACLAATIDGLIVARIAQAVGATAGITLARAIVRDLYARDQAASMIGYVTMGMVVAPMLAPSLGGALDERFGWRAIFVACLVLGMLALLATAFLLPETRPRSMSHVGAGEIARRTLRLLRNRRFLGYAATSALVSAAFFSFVGGAPYLIIDVLGLDKSVYGLWFVLTAGGYMVGNFISGRYSQRVGIERMIVIGCVSALLGSGLILALAWAASPSATALFVPMILVSLGNGFVMPNAIAAGVSVDPEAAGAASGLMGFLQMGLGGVASFTAGRAATASALPLGGEMLVFALLACVVAFAAQRALARAA